MLANIIKSLKANRTSAFMLNSNSTTNKSHLMSNHAKRYLIIWTININEFLKAIIK